MAREAKGLERVGVAGDDLGGRGAAEEIAEQRDEAADEGRVGVAAEVAAAAGVEFADEMDERDAAADAVGIGAFGGSEGREFFRAVDDDREAFLRVVDERELFGKLLLFLDEGHMGQGGAAAGRGKLAPSGWVQHKRCFSDGMVEPLIGARDCRHV